MAGSRPLTKEEIGSIMDQLKNPRDRALVLVSAKTGYRISEILSIKVQDVVQYGQIRDSITVTRANMKGKTCSRTVVLHQEAKKALEEMGVLNMELGKLLFPIQRMQASRILKEATHRARIGGKVSFHSLRKHFAKKVHDLFGKDIVKTQKALGHKSLSSTAHYLQFDQQEIDQAILNT